MLVDGMTKGPSAISCCRLYRRPLCLFALLIKFLCLPIWRTHWVERLLISRKSIRIRTSHIPRALDEGANTRVSRLIISMLDVHIKHRAQNWFSIPVVCITQNETLSFNVYPICIDSSSCDPPPIFADRQAAAKASRTGDRHSCQSLAKVLGDFQMAVAIRLVRRPKTQHKIFGGKLHYECESG